jgi:hypothetical protein
MTRHLKLAVAVLAVLMAISGFAPAKGRSGSRSGSHSSVSKHGHGGGGCSSSHSTSHNYHHHTVNGRYGNSSTRTPSSSTARKPTTKVLSCATAAKPRSVVQLHSSLGYTKKWVVSVTFLDSSGSTVDTGTAEVEVPGHRDANVSVKMPNPSKAAQVASCQVLNVHARY